MLKEFKNVKLANQVLQIVNCCLNGRDFNASGKDKQAMINLFKKCEESGSGFISSDIVRDLGKQCSEQLAFNNDKMSSDKQKQFDSVSNGQIL